MWQEQNSQMDLLLKAFEKLIRALIDKQFAGDSYNISLERTLLDRYGDKPNDTWFDGEVEQSQTSRVNTIRLKLKIFKAEASWTKIFLNSFQISMKFNQVGHTLLFHGARLVSSMEDILRNGIILNLGKKCLDFSNGFGFYLSDDYEAAEAWIKRWKSGTCAILIYRVPNELLAIGETMGVDLNTDIYLWSRVIRYFRRNIPLEQDTLRTVLNASFLKGPVCGNGVQIRKGRSDCPTILKVKGKEFQQYCIRSQQLAQKINSLVVGVVIYS